MSVTPDLSHTVGAAGQAAAVGFSPIIMINYHPILSSTPLLLLIVIITTSLVLQGGGRGLLALLPADRRVLLHLLPAGMVGSLHGEQFGVELHYRVDARYRHRARPLVASRHVARRCVQLL